HTASSGKSTRLAPPCSARAVKSRILRAFPSKSPTVGLIWASAIFTASSLPFGAGPHALPHELRYDRVPSCANRAGPQRKGVAIEFVLAHFRPPYPIRKQTGLDMMRHGVSLDGVAARVGDVVPQPRAPC